MADGAFYLRQYALSRASLLRNRSGEASFSPQPEILVTKPASQPDARIATSSAFPAKSGQEFRNELAARLLTAYRTVRDETERRAASLSPEDQLVQSMPDASPTKWHRAHVTWFWEQFLLGEHSPGYKPYHPDYAYLFNSYYVTAGPRHARAQRGHLTRPGADEVTAYRKHVDAAVAAFFSSADADTLTKL